MPTYFRVDLRAIGPNTEICCRGYDYGEKSDLSKTYWNLKRKLWVTTHFSDITK